MSDSFDQPRPHTQPVRRCATLPTKLRPRRPRSSESLRRSEEDIFFHPCAKIVHFAPRAIAPIPSRTAPADFDYPVDTVETLPWRSPVERTVAFAPLRLQNLHGLTVFLKCGGVVHAILKNSQCWCVDGESTFVLRIRPLTYYRIELPNETENNEHYVLELKDILPKILRYEITPCPFKRGFTIEIPAEAKVPRRKRAWRPKGRRESAPAASVSSSSEDPSPRENEDLLSSAGDNVDSGSFKKRGSSSSTILETIPDDNEHLTPDASDHLIVPRRSVTETPQSFQTLLARFENRTESQADPDTSFSSSIDSSHSFDGSYTFPDSSVRSASTAPSSVDHTELAQDRHDYSREFPDTDFKVDCFTSKDPSDNEDTPSQAPQSPRSPTRSAASERKLSLGAVSETSTERIPTSLAPTDADLSAMSMQFRRRAKASTEREVSPIPPSSLCRSNPSKTDTKSIIQKTCTVVLVPSVQLLLVLIHIAAHIVIGPAINSYVGSMNRRIEYHSPHPQDAVDDFDLPLEPDQSSDSQSQEVKKPNIWEVD